MPARFRIEAPRAASLVLAEAVLVYREAQHNATHAYASIHRVEISDGRPVILAGKPMSPRAARRLARELARQAPASESFLDGRTLYAGDILRVWWVPAGVRHIAFRCAELGERGEAVPHPALVFAVSAKGWWVWACKDNVRPTPETPLCRAPYFNVSDLGAICQGSTVVPTGDAGSRIDAWTDAFFGSFFSHPNGTKVVKHKHGAHAFWKGMLDAPPARFPVRALMPIEKTLADMIAHIGGSMTDPRDAALHAALPIVAAPRHSELPPMATGLRLVVAANGVFTQVRLPWLDCLQRCGGIDTGLPLPYGTFAPWLRLSFGVIPADLLRQFVAQARRAAPLETAAAIIHCERTGALRLAACETVEADRDHLVYLPPILAATEQVVVDLHSHGDAPAFFSALDDADDRAIKLCGVFGRVRSRHPEALFRLAINGLFIDLCDQWDSVVGLAKLEGEA